MLHVLVKDRSKTHDLSLCKACLLANTCNTGSEVNQITGRGRGILSQLIDCRTSRQHGTSQTLGFVFAEHLGEFTDLGDGFIAEIITEGDIDFIGSIDEFLNCSSRGDAESSGIFGQLVELLARCAGIHLLEVFVHALNLLGCLTGIFADVGHLIIHLCIFLYAFLDGEGDAGDGSDGSQSDALHAVEPVCRALDPGLLGNALGSDCLQFCLQLLRLQLHLLELLGTTLHALHLLVQCLDGVLQITDGGGFEVGHGAIDQLHLPLGFLDVYICAVNLLVILLHEGDHLLLALSDALQLRLHQLQL